jgi:phosphoribosylformylglycinamidine cyclo-ligase
VIRKGTWPVLPVFRFVEDRGGVADVEMYRVFNMGMGMLVVVDPADVPVVPERIGETSCYRVGEITAGDGTVEIV